MSRPVVDPEWEGLLAQSRTIITNDEVANDEMVADWDSGKIFHGCSIPPKLRPLAEQPFWICKFFLAGSQRTIARGVSLYQCAWIYDAALIFFESFRSKSVRPYFNHTRDTARKCSQMPKISGYFSSLAAELNSRNEFLRTADQRAADRRSRVSQRQHDTRTSAGRIEKRLSEIESKLEHLDNLAAGINRVELLLATIVHASSITMSAPSGTQNFAKQGLTG